jgi:hypothetical protein
MDVDVGILDGDNEDDDDQKEVILDVDGLVVGIFVDKVVDLGVVFVIKHCTTMTTS